LQKIKLSYRFENVADL